MSIVTLEGVTEHGQIKLNTDVQLPDNIKVYVIVPDMQVEETAHVYSPRLVNPEEATDFEMQVTEEPQVDEL
jgi:hypothetical protein